MTPIVLASTSRSRAAILTAAGVPFGAVAPDVDEEAAKIDLLAAGAGPRAVAETLAGRKALAVSTRRDGLVIGADQTLELDGELCDKTSSLAETRARLLSLRGRAHQLHAAVALALDGAIVWSTLETATLTVRLFSDSWLDGYMARHGEAVASSVGAYHLEGEGAQLMDQVEGDYFAVLGLPLFGLLGALRRHGGLSA